MEVLPGLLEHYSYQQVREMLVTSPFLRIQSDGLVSLFKFCDKLKVFEVPIYFDRKDEDSRVHLLAFIENTRGSWIALNFNGYPYNFGEMEEQGFQSLVVEEVSRGNGQNDTTINSNMIQSREEDQQMGDNIEAFGDRDHQESQIREVKSRPESQHNEELFHKPLPPNRQYDMSSQYSMLHLY